MTAKVKSRMATICLMTAMFLNPFGYDALFKWMLDYTHDYWITVRIFYCLAGLFFGLFFCFSNISIKGHLTRLLNNYINYFRKTKNGK